MRKWDTRKNKKQLLKKAVVPETAKLMCVWFWSKRLGDPNERKKKENNNSDTRSHFDSTRLRPISMHKIILFDRRVPQYQNKREIIPFKISNCRSKKPANKLLYAETGRLEVNVIMGEKYNNNVNRGQ